jgi:hypothetical protein
MATIMGRSLIGCGGMKFITANRLGQVENCQTGAAEEGRSHANARLAVTRVAPLTCRSPTEISLPLLTHAAME